MRLTTWRVVVALNAHEVSGKIVSWRLFFAKLRVHTEENNYSPDGEVHRFLFPFSSKFPDLNFAPYVLYTYSCYMKLVRDTNSEPTLPVVLTTNCNTKHGLK